MTDEYSETMSIKEWEPNRLLLRKDEFTVVSATTKDGLVFTAGYSQKIYASTGAFINICKTLFIVLVLGVASI